MKNLKDAFDALEFELNQQKETHKRQVQEWLSRIRNLGYIKKIDPPNQKRGGELPIEYHITLDSVYNGYEIDNRNLPFEQTEEDVTSPGVIAIPFRAGASIIEMVETIMKYSRRVGQDIEGAPTDAKSFKTNLSYMLKNDNRIHIFIKIKQITTPFNSHEHGDTGPGIGEGAIILTPLGATTPLEFTFKSGKLEDYDIFFLRTSIASDTGIIPLESGERSVVFGNREPVTGERIPPTTDNGEYFKSEYSGLRFPIMPHLNSGLEDAHSAANVDISYLDTNEQSSDHEIEIRGNPNLMFDIQRFPSQAATLDNAGGAKYYKMPESFPMYLKITIYLKKDAVIGLERVNYLPDRFYYNNNYEIVRIINDITNGNFIQNIGLKKTDEIV
jgi:hypothetical protein